MQWFKHLTRARHDPFVFDLRQTFGDTGYWVYFATLEIYAESYQSRPGWFLDVSLDFMKAELGFYHAAKMKKIFDYIRQWPNHSKPAATPGAHEIEALLNDTSVIAPKWVVNLSGARVRLMIPAFTKIMDEYTRKRARQLNATGDHGNPPEAKAAGEENQQARVAMLMSEIARHCEILADAPEKKGRAFPGAAFVGCCIKEGLHPGAIRDGTDFLIHKSKSHQWDGVTDPFAMARGVAKSRNQYYSAFPVDLNMVRKIYGDFFNG